MSFRPLNTTADYYMAFLDGIRREYTTIVPPAKFNRIINQAELDWVMQKLPTREFTQKRLDDLDILRVATDNKFIYNGTVIKEITSTIDNNFFQLPRKEMGSYDDTTGLVTIGGNAYPIYLSGCRIDFRLSSASAEWSEAKILRSDDKAHVLKSPYRSPRKGKIYYDLAGSFVRAYLPEGETALAMNVEYYTYPRKVFFDESNQEDNLQFPATVNGKGPYEAGYGCINSIFSEYQKREILLLAIRILLEERGDPRYRTVLNETAIKQS